MHYMRAVPVLLILLLALAADPAASSEAPDPFPRVRLETSMGDIVLELDRDKAPRTVDNFLRYVQDGFYDGTIFHRVVRNFVIQGGGYTTALQKKATRPPIRNEADNGLRNRRGTIAMARTSEPHSATAQFFINVADNGLLDHVEPTRRGWGYAVFGRVVAGMDVVDRIQRTPTGRVGPFRRDAPLRPVVIRRAVVVAAQQGER